MHARHASQVSKQINVSVFTYMRMFTNTCIHLYIYICIYVRVSTYIYIHTDTHMHAHLDIGIFGIYGTSVHTCVPKASDRSLMLAQSCTRKLYLILMWPRGVGLWTEKSTGRSPHTAPASAKTLSFWMPEGAPLRIAGALLGTSTS